MNMKQFRKPANMHSRTAIAGGRIVGGRGFRLMSKLGKSISVSRLESLLAADRASQKAKKRQ
jgi:hypothetical protein